MRWKTKIPKKDDIRLSQPFAWFPTYMSDNETVVWLEHYLLVEEAYYSECTGYWIWRTISSEVL